MSSIAASLLGSRDRVHTPLGPVVLILVAGVWLWTGAIPASSAAKFSRIQEARQGATKGTGLGLFICRTIVNRHGGKIWAEGQEGEWINFIFELPKSQGRRLVS